MRVVVFFLIEIILFSCSGETTEGINSVSVPDNVNFSMPLSKIMKLRKLICLSLDGRQYIGNIDKVEFLEQKIYILDRFNSNKGVYVFGEKGNFLFQVGHSGEGPGGYDIPYDFQLFPESNEIAILTAGKIMSYNMDSGIYMGSKAIQLPAVRMFNKGDATFFVNGQNHAQLSLTDSNFNEVIGFFPFKPIYSMFPYSPLVKVKGKILFIRNFDNTIYRISGDKVEPYLTINFGEKPLSNSEENIGPEKVFNRLGQKKLLFQNYLETEKLKYFTYVHDEKFYVVLAPLEKNKVKVIDVNRINNDLTFETTFPSIVSTLEDGAFISIVTLDNLGQDNKIKSLCPNSDYAIAVIDFIDE